MQFYLGNMFHYGTFVPFQYCSNLGMHLIEIDSSHENGIIQSIIYGAVGSRSKVTFLGMDSLEAQSPYDFTWYPSGRRHSNETHFSCWRRGAWVVTDI